MRTLYYLDKYAQIIVNQEAQQLNQMLNEIKTMASVTECINSAEWRFTHYGSKACGGPVGYIAYSVNIDTTLFLNKVKAHINAEDTYNKKWGIASDCSLPAQPTGIKCENGNPVFEYEYHFYQVSFILVHHLPYYHYYNYQY